MTPAMERRKPHIDWSLNVYNIVSLGFVFCSVVVAVISYIMSKEKWQAEATMQIKINTSTIHDIQVSAAIDRGEVYAQLYQINAKLENPAIVAVKKSATTKGAKK